MKRFLSLVLSCLLLFSAFPMPAAFAVESSIGIDSEEPENGELTVDQKAALIDGAPLSQPLYTGYEPLDTLVQQIFSSIFTEEMTIYDKVCAIYAYLMDATEYILENPTTNETYSAVRRAVSYQSIVESNEVAGAYWFLKNKTGNCIHYSAAFMIMTRALGLESYVVSCGNTSPYTGTGDHYSGTIRLDDGMYLFDPVMGVVKNQTSEVETSGFFCTPLENLNSREYCNLEETIASFCGFAVQETPVVSTTETISGETTGEIHVSFGSYPQSLVTDADTLTALNAMLDPDAMQSFGYTLGTGTPGTQTVSDYMRYADLTYGGEKYRAVVFDTLRPIYSYYSSSADVSYQDDNGFTPDEVYWFLFEPIEWRVADDSGLLLCDWVLDARSFNSQVYLSDGIVTMNGKSYKTFADAACSVPVNDWSRSEIRAWLNDDFYNTAFSDDEKAQIAQSELKNYGIYDCYDYADSTDHVFLLSKNEIDNDGYFFGGGAETRFCSYSDYALAQGLTVNHKNAVPHGSWMLRTAGVHSEDICIVACNGNLYKHLSAASSMNGVRPALRLTSLSSIEPQTLSAPLRLFVKPVETGVLQVRASVTNGARGYRFYRYTDGSDEPEAVLTSVSPAITDSGLTPGVVYRYRVSIVRVVNGTTEESGLSQEEQARCLTFVASPTDLAGTTTATGVITLTWSAVPDACAYRIYRYVDSDTIVYCGEAQNATSLVLTGLNAGYTYFFKISAVSADGYESTLGSTGAICKCGSIPEKPKDLSVTATATGKLTISWTGAPEAARYYVERLDHSTKTYVEIGSTEETNFSVSGLNPDSAYYFRVIAETADGSSRSVPAYCSGVCESIPPRPQNLSVVSEKPGTITVSWDPVEGADCYTVHHFISSNETEPVTTVTGTTVTLTGLTGGTSYSYCVTAETADGVDISKKSAVARATALNLDTPAGLTYTSDALGCVTLSWDAVPYAEEYRIYRYISTTETTLVGTVAVPSFTETGLAGGKAYAYKVYAAKTDSSCVSVGTPAFTATTMGLVSPAPLTVTPAATGALKLTWTTDPKAALYRVYRYIGSAYAEIGQSVTGVYTDTGLNVGSAYAYRVRGETADGVFTTAYVYATGACESIPAVPQNLAVTAEIPGALTVSWDPVEGADRYTVHRFVTTTETEPVATVADSSVTLTGLKSGRSYSYCVTAETADGTQISKKSAAAKATVLNLDMPAGLSYTSDAIGSVTLRWDAVPYAEEYRVYRYISTTETTQVGTVTVPEFTETGLVGGKAYAYKVYAAMTDGSCLSAGTSAFTATALGLSSPAPLEITPAATGALKLTWTTDPDAALYRVYRYIDSAYTEIGQSETGEFTATGLVVGSRYAFRVRGETADGVTVSAYASATGECESVPAVPQNVTVTADVPGALTVSWDAVEGADCYTVHRYVTSTQTTPVTTVTDTAVTLRGLTVSKSYSYCVTAETADGTQISKKSAAAKATVLNLDMPAGLSYTSDAIGSVTLRWDAVPYAEEYRVYRYISTTETTQVGTVTVPEFTETGLVGGKAYAYKVYAALADGSCVSAGSPAFTATALGLSSPAPLEITPAATGALKLTWTTDPDAALYRVYRYIDSAYTEIGQSETGEFTATGLVVGSRYAFRVRGETADGVTVSAYASATGECESVPAVPQNVTVTADVPGSLTVSWDAVEGADCYTVHRYISSSETTPVTTVTDTTVTLTGLTAAKSYSLCVTAETADGTQVSKKSTAVKGTVLNFEKPLNLTGKAGDLPGRVNLQWDPVPDAQTYLIYRFITNTQTVLVGTSEKPAFTETGLVGGRSYSYRVRAATADGACLGPVSDAAAAAAAALPAPQDLTAAVTGTGQILLTWSAVDGAERYYLRQYDAEAKAYVQIDTVTDPSCVVSGLPAGVSCTFRVQAVGTPDGVEQISVSSSAVSCTARGGPRAPGNIVAQTSEFCDVMLNWSASTDAVGYLVQVRNIQTEEFVNAGETDALSLTVSGLTRGETYIFRVLPYSMYENVRLVGTALDSAPITMPATERLQEELVSLYSATVTYNGKLRTPSVTVKNAAGQTLEKGTDYTVTVPEGRTNAGVYTYTITGLGDYTGTVNKEFTINPQTLTAASVSLYSETVTYNGKLRTPSVTVKNAAGKTLVKGTDYTVTVPEGRTNAGVYLYTITGLGNYAGTVTKEFTINAQALNDASASLYSATVTYNGKLRTPSVTVKNAAGKTLVKGTDYTVDVPEGRINAGVYTYTITGLGNYAGTVTKEFTINAQALNAASVSLYSATVTYNGKLRTPSVTVKNAAGKTLINGTDYFVIVPEGRTDPGTYTYVITGAGNYTGTVTAPFVIREKQ